MAENTRGTELIVAGDLNMDLDNSGGRVRDEEITAAVTTAGLEDLVGNFFLRRRAWCRDWRKWEAVRKGRLVRFRTKYILGSDRWIF